MGSIFGIDTGKKREEELKAPEYQELCRIDREVHRKYMKALDDLEQLFKDRDLFDHGCHCPKDTQEADEFIRTNPKYLQLKREVSRLNTLRQDLYCKKSKYIDELDKQEEFNKELCETTLRTVAAVVASFFI